MVSEKEESGLAPWAGQDIPVSTEQWRCLALDFIGLR